MPSMTAPADYVLEFLREGTDFTLYRGFISSHQARFDCGSKDDLKSADADSPVSASRSMVIGET
jgi:hypothetical protein